ncbi:cytochrome b-245 chaperone 1-like [Pluvialis apricaria]
MAPSSKPERCVPRGKRVVRRLCRVKIVDCHRFSVVALSSAVTEAVFDKSKGTVCLKTFNLYKKILTFSKGVVALLNEIRDVNVEEETVRYFGKGYLVVLRFVTGFSHPLTQSAVLGCRSDVEAVAKLITSFLELDRIESQEDLSQSSETEASDADEPQDKYQ